MTNKDTAMPETDDGGPAFPMPGQMSDDGRTILQELEPGMSLRDYFAGQMLTMMLATQAMQSQLEVAINQVHGDRPDGDRRAIAREIIGKRCYLQADAMLEARKQ